jgi:hypothetical protein
MLDDLRTEEKHEPAKELNWSEVKKYVKGVGEFYLKIGNERIMMYCEPIETAIRRSNKLSYVGIAIGGIALAFALMTYLK